MQVKSCSPIAISFAASLLIANAALAQLPSTTRVSVDSAGAQANSDSRRPAFSADGRYVAFPSAASNLVAGDTNGTDDVFVRNLQTGATERVSVSSLGAEANASSSNPAFSADGRYLTFSSGASNLVPGDTNNAYDVFVRDRQLGTTERVSVESSGIEANSHSSEGQLSADGRYVAFVSFASNLAPLDTNGTFDIFVRDRVGLTTDLVSMDSGFTQGNWSSFSASISADARFIAFSSLASNLAPGDTNAASDIFVRDRQTGATQRVSVDSSGAQANAASVPCSISSDGRYVVFDSAATNLVPGDNNDARDIFVRDRLAGTTGRMSVNSGGVEAIGNGSFSRYACISNDGRYVAFVISASNLVAGDSNGAVGVFVRDRGPLQPVAYCTSSTSTNGCIATIAGSEQPSVSLAHACTLTVAHVEGLKSGIVFYGINNTAFAPGPWAPGSTSLLCVKHPTQRTTIQNSGGAFGACDGSLVLDWNGYQTAHPLALGSPWSVGDRVYVQAWFRDPLAVKSTNLSSAIEMTYLP